MPKVEINGVVYESNKYLPTRSYYSKKQDFYLTLKDKDGNKKHVVVDQKTNNLFSYINNLDDFIKNAKKWKDALDKEYFYIYCDIGCEEDYECTHSHYEYYFCMRDENEEEKEKRLKQEEKDRENARKSREKLKAQNEEKDKKEFQRLKKKFENEI